MPHDHLVQISYSSYERMLINKLSDLSIFFRILFLDEIFNHVRKSRGLRTTYCTAENLQVT